MPAKTTTQADARDVPRDPVLPADGDRRRAAPGRERLLDIAVVAAPCAIAAVLAFHQITGRSLWLDEAASVAISSQHGAALWHAMEHDGGNMLAYYALLHVVMALFGDAALVIRFPSAIATAATVALVCLLGRRLFDRRVALAAGLLSAVSLPLVYWGQNARSYALMMTFVAASFLAFVALVDREADTPASRWMWLAYVATTVLAAYMSFEALLIVPAQLLSLAWFRRSQRVLRLVVSALAATGVCCLPLLVLAEARGKGQLFWVPKPNLIQVHQMLEALLSSGLQPNFHLTATGTLVLVLSGALLAATAAMLPRSPGTHESRRSSWPQVLVLCWLVVPIGIGLLESLLVQPITLPRAAILSLPAVSLLLARGAMDVRVPRLLGWSAVGVVLILRALQLGPSYGTSPENWRAASVHVLALTRPGDCIAFYPSDGRQAFSYYIGSNTPAAARAPRSVLPAVSWGEVKPYVEDYVAPSSSGTQRIEASCTRLWFVSSHRGQKTGPPTSRIDYARYRALLGSLTSGYARHQTVSYGWASPVRVELFTR
jgi:mannosyltransferase